MVLPLETVPAFTVAAGGATVKAVGATTEDVDWLVEAVLLD